MLRPPGPTRRIVSDILEYRDRIKKRDVARDDQTQ